MGLDILKRQPESYSKKKDYVFNEILGDGTFGVVKRATWKGNQLIPGPIEVAVKVIPKKKVKGHESIVYDEMRVLKGLEHPNVVKLYDWFESKTKFSLVFEIAKGGELFNRICEQGKLTEADAVETMRATLEGVKYLHDHGVVHRDLKPENLLFRSTTSNDLLIADFGIARLLESDSEVLTAMAGSPGYASPEVLNSLGHGKPCDIWSIGIICYTLLCGFTPFRSEDRKELIAETTKARLEFTPRYWKNVSEEAKDFIKTLVRPDPADRPTAEEALRHKWLSDHVPDKHTDLSEGLRENWNATKKWKDAIAKVQAAQRLAKGGKVRHERVVNSRCTSPVSTPDDSDAEFVEASEPERTDTLVGGLTDRTATVKLSSA